MRLRIIFLDALIAFFITICPFTFTNPFASSFKDPTHEECRQWASNHLYVGLALSGLSVISCFTILTSRDSIPIPAMIGIGIPNILLSVFSSIYSINAFIESSQHKNPQQTSEWLNYQKHCNSYKKNIDLLRQKNESLRSLFYNKRFQIGAGAIGLGLLTSFSSRDTSNPAFILTFAGTVIVAEKIFSAIELYTSSSSGNVPSSA